MKEEEGKQEKKSHSSFVKFHCSCQRSSISNLRTALSQCTCVIINNGAPEHSEGQQKANSVEVVVQNNCTLLLDVLQSSDQALFNFFRLLIIPR